MELVNIGVEQVLQVHDSAVMEVPEDGAQEIAAKVIEIMEDHTRFQVPFIVDVAWGRNLTCKEGEL